MNRVNFNTIAKRYLTQGSLFIERNNLSYMPGKSYKHVQEALIEVSALHYYDKEERLEELLRGIFKKTSADREVRTLKGLSKSHTKSEVLTCLVAHGCWSRQSDWFWRSSEKMLEVCQSLQKKGLVRKENGVFTPTDKGEMIVRRAEFESN